MNFRRATSLTMLISFIPLLLTSIILYIVPEGRVAYWSDWRMMGLTKTQWGDIHINLGWLFLAAGLLHLVYNWKPIVAYMKNRAKELKVFTAEFNVALFLTIIFTAGTLLYIPPFSSILEFGGSFKDAAADKYGEPPYGHAELSSLQTLTRRMGLDLELAQKNLKAANIQFTDVEQSVLEIAKTNNTTPRGVWDVVKNAGVEIKTDETPIFPEAPSPGLGRKILQEIITEYGLDTQLILDALAAKGITASPERNLKDIAADNGSDPHVLYEIMYEAVNKK